jgi:hypothetical protein
LVKCTSAVNVADRIGKKREGGESGRHGGIGE